MHIFTHDLYINIIYIYLKIYIYYICIYLFICLHWTGEEYLAQIRTVRLESLKTSTASAKGVSARAPRREGLGGLGMLLDDITLGNQSCQLKILYK
jgi:hypothetical protein